MYKLLIYITVHLCRGPAGVGRRAWCPASGNTPRHPQFSPLLGGAVAKLEELGLLCKIENVIGTSLVVQWLTLPLSAGHTALTLGQGAEIPHAGTFSGQWLRLPMQGAQVQSLIKELDPTCCN